MKKAYIILIVIILAAAGGWFYYQNQQQDVSVEYIKVQEVELVESLRASGIVKPEKSVQISSIISGNIEKIFYEEGSKVQKDDILLKFDDSLAQAEYNQTLAQLNSAKASLEQTKASINESETQISLAEIKLKNASDSNSESLLGEIEQAELEIQNAINELNRRQYLYENDAIEKVRVEEQEHLVNVLKSNKSILEKRLIELVNNKDNRVEEAKQELKRAEISFQTSQKQYNVALENINSAQAALEKAKVNLSNYTKISPITGVVLDQNVEVGEYVQPGRVLFTIGTEELQIEISPDEKELNLLSVGKKGFVSPEAYPNERYEVEIFRISPNIDPDRGTIDVYLKPVKENTLLIPNMSVSVEIINDKNQKVILIPTNYILVENNQRFVYKYVNGNAEKQNIDIEKQINGRTIITKGLNIDDIVLNPNGITAGQSVTIEER